MGELFAGRYELVDPIGRGGAGAVWRAWDHRRHAYVAAKVLRQSDAHSLIRFVREQALRIDHPHVLAPRSWAADDEQVLFTMELVRGGSLAHLIGDYGPLPPRYVCALLDQLLSGLSAVHDENVVHRDVKPANILLESTGTGRPHVRLSDFGIAMRKGEPRLTGVDHVVGTPGYFAPEQLLGAEPDFPADLYAVGLVALYLLTGRKPDARALVERFTALGGMPHAPVNVPDALWEVAATLLHPNPELRFRSATGARKALARAAELLPEPSFDDEPIEVFDQLGPLPAGFGPRGPAVSPAGLRRRPAGDEALEDGEFLDGGSPDTGGRPAGPAESVGAAGPVAAAPGSETGFPLAPPRPAGPAAAPPFTPPAPARTPPAPMPPTPSTGVPLPVPVAAAPHATGHTAPYTALSTLPGAMPEPAGTPVADRPGTPATPPARARARGHAARRASRPRPALRLVAGMYLAAAVFLAIGIWALTA
ncbi:serine/threonine-protein kinase [Streptomyces sp. SL13]|uniref:non-specific serine/threonine protein kinase n=1 Tax=Streptantibioticus silvisoli TaxID=2705255 RepID=A0AA90JXW8_9ACTN|nr:serine/threonine-protein kinase [Streptantibioticus silvisoli]MDI5970571.1 serine/threonine-protein kinase [Streptantibioticus silvisoli]